MKFLLQTIDIMKETTQKTKVKDVLTEDQILNLPKWVRKDIDNAYFVNDGKTSIEISDGRRYCLGNSINDLSGGEWTRNICSVINTHYSTKGEDGYAHNIRKIHPTPKPPQLMKELIEFFTKENEIVFDYFMGVGGSLLGASLCHRRGAGIDLNQDYIDAYKKASQQLYLPIQPCLCGNSDSLLDNESTINQLLCGEKAGMILIDPPYANMMSKEKTGTDIAVYGSNSATPFTNSQFDLGNIPPKEFIPKLKSIVEKSLKYLKPKGYVVVFCKDMQPKKKETNLLHAEIVSALNGIPKLYYRGLKIWADQTVKLFPYGYPFDFVANQIHQYILIFRKY
ncbi:MAG: DNA methyltransferase [Candidatus Coproplasma sp.]